MAIGKTYEIVLDIDGEETVLHDLRITKFSHGDEDSFVNESVTKREDQFLSTLYTAKISYTQDKIPSLDTTLRSLVEHAKDVTQRVFGEVFPKPVVPTITPEIILGDETPVVFKVPKKTPKVKTEEPTITEGE